MPWFHKLTELATGIVEPPPMGLPSPLPPRAMLLIPLLPSPSATLLEPLPPIPVLILRARSFARLIVSRSLEKQRNVRNTV